MSAGARFAVWPITATPTRSACAINSSGESEVRNPGMDSSLSTVPPVCPSPRPDILATFPPRDATIGATISVVLSPTPPVECLSAVALPNRERSTLSPERAMQPVSVTVSRLFMPRKYIAMHSAAAW